MTKPDSYALTRLMEQNLENAGSVVWLTGLSGAGKTTIAQEVWARAKSRIRHMVLIDGDVIRALFGPSLGFHEEARVTQIKRLQSMAKMLSDQGLVVVVAALYASDELLAWNRENLPNYFEVYVKADLETVRGRDVKGLYAAAAAGEQSNVVGLDIPWNTPQSPDLIIDTSGDDTPVDSAEALLRAAACFREQ